MLLIVQNDPEVPPGIFADMLRDRGVPFRTLLAYTGEPFPAVPEAGAVMVLGGAMGVHETERYPFLLGVKEYVAACVRQDTPFLGICLGGQLLADVLGATVVTASPYGEKGTLPVHLTDTGRADPLFAGIDEEFLSFQWHNDSFTIPEGGVLLASSPACPYQAFRFGRSAYGTQFHPEVSRAIVELWAGSTTGTAPRLSEFLARFDAVAPLYREASRRLLENFLRISSEQL